MFVAAAVDDYLKLVVVVGVAVDVWAIGRWNPLATQTQVDRGSPGNAFVMRVVVIVAVVGAAAVVVAGTVDNSACRTS